MNDTLTDYALAAQIGAVVVKWALPAFLALMIGVCMLDNPKNDHRHCGSELPSKVMSPRGVKVAIIVMVFISILLCYLVTLVPYDWFNWRKH